MSTSRYELHILFVCVCVCVCVRVCVCVCVIISLTLFGWSMTLMIYEKNVIKVLNLHRLQRSMFVHVVEWQRDLWQPAACDYVWPGYVCCCIVWPWHPNSFAFLNALFWEQKICFVSFYFGNHHLTLQTLKPAHPSSWLPWASLSTAKPLMFPIPACSVYISVPPSEGMLDPQDSSDNPITTRQHSDSHEYRHVAETTVCKWICVVLFLYGCNCYNCLTPTPY